MVEAGLQCLRRQSYLYTMATKFRKADIPTYELGDFRHVHRVPNDKSEFGYNSLPRSKYVAGFELYSGNGLVGSVGPLRSVFYRISLTVTGGLDMQIGLEHYRHEPRTLGFTFPNQLFFKNNISADASGYYMFFRGRVFGRVVAGGPAAGGVSFPESHGCAPFPRVGRGAGRIGGVGGEDGCGGEAGPARGGRRRCSYICICSCWKPSAAISGKGWTSRRRYSRGLRRWWAVFRN